MVEDRTARDVLMTGSVIATLPMIVVVSIVERQFIQGIALTGVKG